MRVSRMLVCLVLCSACPGCLVLTGAKNLVVESFAHCTLECVEFKRNEALAVAAWDGVCATHPEGAFSIHYAEGFRQGFVDYLNAGGTGEPPPVPPRKYWGVRYETPQGFAAVEEWFAGFRHGSSAAQGSGYRQFVVLPTPLGPMPNSVIAPAQPLSNPQTAPRPDPMTQPEELKFPPREIPPQPENSGAR